MKKSTLILLFVILLIIQVTLTSIFPELFWHINIPCWIIVAILGVKLAKTKN